MTAPVEARAADGNVYDERISMLFESFDPADVEKIIHALDGTKRSWFIRLYRAYRDHSAARDARTAGVKT